MYEMHMSRPHSFRRGNPRRRVIGDAGLLRRQFLFAGGNNRRHALRRHALRRGTLRSGTLGGGTLRRDTLRRCCLGSGGLGSNARDRRLRISENSGSAPRNERPKQSGPSEQISWRQSLSIQNSIVETLFYHVGSRAYTLPPDCRAPDARIAKFSLTAKRGENSPDKTSFFEIVRPHFVSVTRGKTAADSKCALAHILASPSSKASSTSDWSMIRDLPEFSAEPLRQNDKILRQNKEIKINALCRADHGARNRRIRIRRRP